MRIDRRLLLVCIVTTFATVIVASCGHEERVAAPGAASHDASSTTPSANRDDDDDNDTNYDPHAEATTLYVWASDQAHRAPDFLAVIDFDRHSPNYGNVLRTVPIPPPGNIGNEPHHCHTSIDHQILACGGLLSVLKNQNDIFFFDISNARHPRFLFSTRARNSSITDDFLPLPNGGFLVTNMGSASGGAGGRVVEFDRTSNT